MATLVEGDVEIHAAAFLTEKGIAHKRIVRVYPDAILFVSAIDNAMTAWLEYDEIANKVTYQIESGFPSERK